MDTSSQEHVASHAFNGSTRLRIADLKDDLHSTITDDSYVEATVQLVWPFSSSTSQISFLLVENDISVYETTAQARTIFHGACAREVAKSKIGIGDTLRLRLRGGVVEPEREQLSTPGKKAGFDLHFRRVVNLQVGSAGVQWSHTGADLFKGAFKWSICQHY